MNIGKFCPLPLCTLIGNFRIHLYIVSRTGVYCQSAFPQNSSIGCTPKGSDGNTAKKGSGKVLGKDSGEGFWGRVLRRVLRRGPAVGFTEKTGSGQGSQKGF